MEYRTFGKTGIEVSRIGLGCYQMGGTHGGGGWPGMDDEESVRTIHHAETLGVNLLDTAEGYGAGHSERIIGRALADRRSRYVVATKVAPPVDGDSEADARTRVQTACAGSLQRLGTDYIDIYQLHGVPPSELMPAVVEELTALQQAGRIRCWGISTNDGDAMRELLRLGDLAMAQVGLSIVNPTADDALGLALEANLGTLIRVPLGQGALTGKYFDAQQLDGADRRHERFTNPRARAALAKLAELRFLTERGRTMVQAALRFVLDTPGVTAAIPGARDRAQLEQNAGAVDVPPLSPEERERAMRIGAESGWPQPPYAKKA